MRAYDNHIWIRVDWLLVVLYASLVLFGWFNIYAASYEPGLPTSSLALPSVAARQLLWIAFAALLFVLVLLLEVRLYQSLAYIFYGCSLLLLGATLCWGVSRGGHKSWLQYGGQPAEFAKLACAMAIAKYIHDAHAPLTARITQWSLLGFILCPVVMILLQGDAGSSLVFIAFGIVLYREGLPLKFFVVGLLIMFIALLTVLVARIYLVWGTIAIAFVLLGLAGRGLKRMLRIIGMAAGILIMIEGGYWITEHALKPYQYNRLKTLFTPHIDPLGIGWNVTQSKVAIGSGGFWGKGFLQGSQTKYGFVPEQRTDFIFCTIGEEYGWLGAVWVISIFIGLVCRIMYLAERQTYRFTRVYGYAIAALLFCHFMINVGMTIGLMPVIGIPLPFISYGGSSLCSFSLMLFIFLKLDAERYNYHFRRLDRVVELT